VLQRVISLGTSAVGQLMAYASVDIDTGELSQDAIEALGWLLAELGAGAAACMELAATCKRATADNVKEIGGTGILLPRRSAEPQLGAAILVPWRSA